MDSITGTSSAYLDQYSSKTGDSVTMRTMNMAMDIQVNAAAQLIESVALSTQAISGRIGTQVDVKV